MARRGANEDGFTLVETLIALVILGFCAVTLLGALGLVTTSSGVYRKQTDAGTALQSAAEALVSPKVAFVCTATMTTVPATYKAAVDAAAAADGSNTTITITSIGSFDGAAYTRADGCADPSLVMQQQLITLNAVSPDAAATTSLRVVKRG